MPQVLQLPVLSHALPPALVLELLELLDEELVEPLVELELLDDDVLVEPLVELELLLDDVLVEPLLLDEVGNPLVELLDVGNPLVELDVPAAPPEPPMAVVVPVVVVVVVVVAGSVPPAPPYTRSLSAEPWAHAMGTRMAAASAKVENEERSEAKRVAGMAPPASGAAH